MVKVRVPFVPALCCINDLTRLATINRMVMESHTFKDGFHLPAGTQLSFPTERYRLDPGLHWNLAVFDTKRHLRKHKRVDSAKYHFASTADSLV